MKNNQYENRKKQIYRKSCNGSPVVTRKRLMSAFSGPCSSRTEVLKIVVQFMGDSPVPPSWTSTSVRGVFGVKVQRTWKRHIRKLRKASYREDGLWVQPVTQTMHDFHLGTAKPVKAMPTMPFIMDEGHEMLRGVLNHSQKFNTVKLGKPGEGMSF